MRIRAAMFVSVCVVLAVGCKKKSSQPGGWFVGSEGLMVYVDGDGEVHDDYNLTTPDRLNGIACRYDGEAWVVGAKGTVLYTNDGGDVWQPQLVPTTAELRTLATQDTGPVYLAGDGVFLTATPSLDTGAAQWLDVGNGVTSFRSVAAAQRATTVLAVSEQGQIWAYDSGQLIHRTTIPGARAIAVSPDGNTALVVGTGMSLSRDAGQTWAALPLATPGELAEARVDDRGEGLAVGANGLVARIDYEGRVLTQYVGTTNLHTMFVPWAGDDRPGFAAGDGGQVWMTADTGWTWTAGPQLAQTVLGVDVIGDGHR